MKTSELIALLQQRLETHGDLPVMVTWEGVFYPIEPLNVYRSKDGVEHYDIKEPTLLVDAYDNFYKPEFAQDPDEGK